MINETGNQYGYLTVVKEIKKRNRNRLVCWECLCKCGKTVVVEGSNLRKGNTKSCGCFNKERIIQSNMDRTENLIGKKIGKLLVLEMVDFLIRPNGNRNRQYKCLCDCGNTTIVTGVRLKTGHTTSCGCIRSKGELEISQILLKNGIKFKKEFSFDDLKDMGKLKFDFAIFNKNDKLIKLIEYQGIQHFDKKNPYYSEEGLKRDEMKREYCKKENIPLIEIPFTLLGKITLKDLELNEHANQV